MRGNFKTVEELKQDCNPIVVVGDLNEDQKYSLNGEKMHDSWPAIPCGLQAKSMFTDKFSLSKMDGPPIELEDNDIAWKSDVEFKFKNLENIPADALNGDHGDDYKNIQWLDMTDPHFIVWMRSSALPNFRKLYGKIQNGIKKGEYVVRVTNKYNVQPFDGAKSIVLTTTTSLGGNNSFLAWAFMLLGVFCFAYEIIFIITLRKKRA